MTKPTLSSFNTVAEIMIDTYERYLPTAFDESLTLLEKVNKLIEYLNQIGKLNNDLVVQWNSVMEWVMNEGLTQSVSERLDEMATDGTLTNLINIEMVDKKVHFYSTVSEMISDQNIKVNTVCQTMGYHQTTDGGGSKYSITDQAITADGSFVISLTNGLKAKLILEGGEVKAEQLGFKKDDPTFDCGTLFRSLMNGDTPNCVVVFGMGSYYFSETTVQQNNSLKIRGVKNSFTHTKGTNFSPYAQGQRYILKLGGNPDFTVPVNYQEKQLFDYMVDWIWFNDLDQPLQNLTAYNEQYGLLCIEYSAAIYLNVGFVGHSRPIFMRSSWEIQFDNLYFRGCYTEDGLFYIGNVLNDAYSNISAIVIKNLDIETYRSTVFVGVDNANVNDITIHHCNIETDVVETSEITVITDGSNYKNYAKYPLFFDGIQIKALKIGSLNLQVAMRGYYLKNGVNTVSYLFKGCPKGSNIYVDNIYTSGEVGGFFGVAYDHFESYGKLVIGNLIFDPYNAGSTGVYGSLRPTYYHHEIISGLIDIQHTNGVPFDDRTLKYGSYDGLELSTFIQLYAGKSYYASGALIVDGSQTCRTYDFNVLSDVKLIIRSKSEWLTSFRVHKTLNGVVSSTDYDKDSSFANKMVETVIPINRLEADSFYIAFMGSQTIIYSVDVVPA